MQDGLVLPVEGSQEAIEDAQDGDGDGDC